MSLNQHPYIPNSNEKAKKEMLDYIGVSTIADLYSFIPDDLRTKNPLGLPKPYYSEQELQHHVNSLLAKNRTTEEFSSFLGAGCYNHHVPAVCDEINSRSEFLTAYSGDTYADHGKLQAIFEFTSMMGELLNMDVVGFPTYDGGQSASTALMMSKRITGRSIGLVPSNTNPNLLNQMIGYCEGMDLVTVKCNEKGQIDLADLTLKLNEDVACVFIQNPSFFGSFEEKAREIGRMAHEEGALFVVYTNPITLGVMEPPANYGADICCGDIQPLGIHMSYGSSLGGFLATRQEEAYVLNYPHHLYSIFENSKGEYGFARALPERTSYYSREEAVEYLGTCVGLWAITAAVYLAVMGPEGMKDLGENILYKTKYAKQKLQAVKGIELPFADNYSFMEFVVDLNKTKFSVADVNRALLKQDIFGGFDLSRFFPEWGQTMLLCVTEKTSFEQIDNLAVALSEILKGGTNGTV